MTLLTLLQSQAASVAATGQATGGGWDAHQFAKLLRRRKKRLREDVREIIAEAAPVAREVAAELPQEPDTLGPMIEQARAALERLEIAATAQTLARIEAEISALRERIEEEIDEEETLLLLAA